MTELLDSMPESSGEKERVKKCKTQLVRTAFSSVERNCFTLFHRKVAENWLPNPLGRKLITTPRILKMYWR